MSKERTYKIVGKSIIKSGTTYIVKDCYITFENETVGPFMMEINTTEKDLKER